MGSAGHIAILMATYDGADYIGAQLQSIADQTHRDWSLWISDDGSTDATRAIIAGFAAQNPGHDIQVLDGPRQGSIANFMSLAGRVPLAADAYAFADQDDVWRPSRLELSLGGLASDAGRPSLSGSRTVIVDRMLRAQGHSPLFSRPPAFANALVQSLAGGNTMLLNRAGFEALREAGTGLDVVAHDWWSYQLISGIGGSVTYGTVPTVLYRQHGGNVIGSNNGTRARLARAVEVWNDRFIRWNDRNLAALRSCEAMLTPQNRALLDRFAELRALRGLRAVRALDKAGIYRQTRGGDISLRLAAAFGKM